MKLKRSYKYGCYCCRSDYDRINERRMGLDKVSYYYNTFEDYSEQKKIGLMFSKRPLSHCLFKEDFYVKTRKQFEMCVLSNRV